MGLIGFNSGMSDALNKIMEQRLKQKQQDFENNLKTQEAQQKAEAHAADLELKRETLAQVKQQKEDAAAEKLQKNIGVGGETTAAQDKQLSHANLPVSGGVTLPSVTKVGFGGPMADVAPPDLSGDGPITPEAAPVAPAPAQGTLQTSAAAAQPVFHPAVDQRTQPPQAYNPLTGSGARVPTLNTGSAEQRQAKTQREALQHITQNSDKMSEKELFSALIGAGYDPDKASATVENLRGKTTAGRQPTFEANLTNPKTGNTVVYITDGPQGPGLYDTVTHEVVPNPKHYQAPQDPGIQALRTAQTDNANAKRLDDSYNRTTAILEKIATPLEASEQRLGRLSDTLAQNTPQSDALVAPELMVVMAGGQGSGVRINKAEIERVVGGRTAYTALQTALNKFRLDPNHAQIPQVQRDQIASLIKVVQDKITAKQDALLKMRMIMADPTSTVEEHRKALADLHDTLTRIDTTPAPGGQGTLPTSAAPTEVPTNVKITRE